MQLLGRVADRLTATARSVRVAQGVSLVALGLLSLSGGAAWAGDTVGVVIDPATGLVQMVVVPDSDAELADPAYNPPSSIQVRLPKAQFAGGTPEQFVARVSEAAKRTLKTQMAPAAAPPGPKLTPAEAAAFERTKIEMAKTR